MEEKRKCPHVIKHIQASCGCCIDCPSKMKMLLMDPTEEHLARHREADAGITHSWNCEPPMGLKKIPIPELVLNEKLMSKMKSNNSTNKE